ncbi:MAG: hypothetical protein A3D31_06260 [Candidatus Fluviicola riflensis]|nr:MAG: hypothetical protein CHH17_08755 [Candidatus Fluviicola riflensis]OGS79566.1 MAG: hypothetical protein A3D31_06260 [Candidatus Fluviicola riflensis]OGS86997.1 MAG: hypothetical protein A2724_05720 [Fluviicola sp. RIFCSPHIGHO2_01_FULL_43_53]OGS89788.1 MAG: hypothetical protein A3E30_02465 [Fluviicola sp. RIFCSPHIGHO2_12_FULL_43_24]
MEEKRVALVVGAKYFVSGELCTLLHKEGFDYVLFGVGKSYHLESYSNTEELKNPIFNLRNFHYSIKDYTLETGDYCEDFNNLQARRLLRLSYPKMYSKRKLFNELAEKALKANKLFLFSSEIVPGEPLLEGKEYYFEQFFDRYKNFILIKDADTFR